MVNVKRIVDHIHSLCPPSLAFDGDNVGLIVGRADKEVSKILITLDVDEKVVNEAKKTGADMIVSHHPLMFHPIKRLTVDNPMQCTLMSLIESDISLFSAHTNMDCVRGGLNDYLAQRLGINDTTVIETVAEIDGVAHGFGRFGIVDDGMLLGDMIEKCKAVLDTPCVRYVGNPDRPLKKVAVNCGAGADEIDVCIKLGADLFITGDVKYNPARDCFDAGMALIDAGHYETEHIVCELFDDILSKDFPEVKLHISKENIPVWNYR